jgi:hypothetical protein
LNNTSDGLLLGKDLSHSVPRGEGGQQWLRVEMIPEMRVESELVLGGEVGAQALHLVSGQGLESLGR